MSTISTAEPRFRSALDACVNSLRRLAAYRLDPALDRHLQSLAERKDLLNAGEHDELAALVAFTQHRSIERLEAEAALKRLHDLFPDLVVPN